MEFIALLGAVSCATQPSSVQMANDLSQLSSENERLRNELTALQERSIAAERPCAPSEGPEHAVAAAMAAAPSDEAQPSAESSQAGPLRPHPAKPDLPVVRLTPTGAAADAGAEQEPLLAPASEPAEDTDDASTRPVLKVRGKHEAWVYHRPVEPESEGQEPTH